MNQHIQQACDLVGGQTALANALTAATGQEVSQQRVRNWIFRDDEVPTDFLAPLELITNGHVTRKAMRPNDWQTIWPELVEKVSA